VGTSDNMDVEHLYRRVAHETEKAIIEKDYDRALAMSRRAANGSPKVMTKLAIEGRSEGNAV
jgi:hypothetical protein